MPLISLEETLKSLKISREQLVDIAILTGTDYNEGVKGIGPKTALKLVRKFGGIEKLLASGKIQTAGVENYKEVREIFLAPKVTSAYELKWHPPDEEKVLEFLCEEHDSPKSEWQRLSNACAKAWKQTKEQAAGMLTRKAEARRGGGAAEKGRKRCLRKVKQRSLNGSNDEFDMPFARSAGAGSIWGAGAGEAGKRRRQNLNIGLW